MKTLITLLLSVGSFATVFAQSDYDRNSPHGNPEYANQGYAKNDNSNHGYNDRGYDRGHDVNFRDKDFQIEKINHEYNWKINSVMENFNLRFREKNRIVRGLEKERAEKIRCINVQYDDHFRNNDRDYNRDNRYH